MYLFSADDIVVNARKCLNLECRTVQSRWCHFTLNCISCVSNVHSAMTLIFFSLFSHAGKKILPGTKIWSFPGIFFSVKMLPFYICDCCHMRGKFQMPVNYLFVCLF